VNHKVNDIVRIRSKEWIDAQEKDFCENGNVKGARLYKEIKEHAGKIAKVVTALPYGYKLDVDGGAELWQGWMFDPDYNPYEMLSAEDAIRAMLAGETLYDKEGHWAAFNNEKDCFEYEGFERNIIRSEVKGFSRHPAKRKRPMTRWEMLAWTNSEASREWLVRLEESGAWRPPQFHGYDRDGNKYQRARLRPDLSGIDENTVQGFEVEE
jgi:hypothetical protein